MNGQLTLFDEVMREPPYTIAYGAGVDSTAMTIELLARGTMPDLILMADPGWEHPETLEYVRDVFNPFLRRQGAPLVQVVRYIPQRTKLGPYVTIAQNCAVNHTLPSLAFGFKSCSMKFKAKPAERLISRFWRPGIRAIRQGLKIRRAIGFDAGPKDSRRAAIGEGGHFVYDYPLKRFGMDRGACEGVIRNAGLPVPRKSSCVGCPAMRPAEVAELAKQHPELLDQVIAIEDRARPYLKKVEGLWRRATRKRPGSWREFVEKELNYVPRAVEEFPRVEGLPEPVAVLEVPGLQVLLFEEGVAKEYTIGSVGRSAAA